MTTYKIQVPMTAAVVVKTIGKKNGKIVLEIVEAKNADCIGAYVRYTQEWLDSSPSVTKLS